MLNLGKVKPGTTLRIPFSSFDKDDGSSITMTNFTAAKILVYKDGNTTERASTAGYTATTDFDAKTGKHIAIITLSDNTTAGHFAAGSEYLVAIDAVTVDAVVTGGWIARFTIGYDGAILDTTIATLASQTSFTLTAGPAENDAIKGMWCIIHDVASAVQLGYAIVSAYTGSTRTVTLAAGTTFTVAATDNISVMGIAPVIPVVPGRQLAVDASNLVAVPDTQKVDVETIKSQAVTLAGGITFPAATVASTTNITAGTFANLTNLPTIPNDWITAAGIASGAFTAAKFAAGAFDAVWSVATRTLSSFGTLVADTAAAVWASLTASMTTASSIGKKLADWVIGTAQTGDTFPLANGVNGFAPTKADTAAILLRTDVATSTRSVSGDAMTLTSGERSAIAAALLDLANGIEAGVTPRQAARAIAAVAVGLLPSGAGSATEAFKGIGQAAGGTTRVTNTVDADGNRTATTLNL